ncbi:hypothetical protein BDK92_6431 [Micromonospora pisi]|uniref:Thiazolylpeptide-type bacteriocin n=1 Tax=Micromonospora pisi TaxID=589240 RepID=A0A495JSM1_9ACTN|nr:thiazolylpeptide-type bacteriocin [Micromonospora pisi]RKR92000.1 hypothetical protein BDK92_6431 [Micromonospora pisi]
MELDVFDLDDLDLDDITVTSMRDAVALPETGMSSSGDAAAACSCCGSSSCCPNIDTYQPY